jgi:hypothetical protein
LQQTAKGKESQEEKPNRAVSTIRKTHKKRNKDDVDSVTHVEYIDLEYKCAWIYIYKHT